MVGSHEGQKVVSTRENARATLRGSCYYAQRLSWDYSAGVGSS
jgi:hypothetical protein